MFVGHQWFWMPEKRRLRRLLTSQLAISMQGNAIR
jgi:hypothetical protein